MTQSTMIVMIRWGLFDPDTVWQEVAAFSTGSLSYSLLKSAGAITPELISYAIEIRAEGIPVRRAKIGVLISSHKGLAFEFLNVPNDAIMNYFHDVKHHYINGAGDDWFTIAMTTGELYYTSDLQSFAANAWEAEQRRMVLRINPDFKIEFGGLDNIIHDEDEPLDDIWNNWRTPDDNE